MTVEAACERLFTLMENQPAGYVNPSVATYDRMLAQYAAPSQSSTEEMISWT